MAMGDMRYDVTIVFLIIDGWMTATERDTETQENKDKTKGSGAWSPGAEQSRAVTKRAFF